MADILYFDHEQQKLVTSLSSWKVSGTYYTSFSPGQILFKTLVVQHNSPYSIKVNGFFLSKADDYQGNDTAYMDYREIIRWGDEYNKGLSIGQLISGDVVYTRFQNQQGSSRDYPIELDQNGGTILSRGRKGETGEVLDRVQIILKLEVPNDIVRPVKLNFGLDLDFYELSL